MTGKISRNELNKFIKKFKAVKLNLGSGDDYKEGFINIDVVKSIKADIHTDFVKGIPFPDNSVDFVYCKNVFEHVPNPLDFLLEIKRVLKTGGKARIITSNASYLIYHFPRKKAYHDSYNLDHPIEDQHYFMFQKGHLAAFTKRAGLILRKLEYYIANENPGKDRAFQQILGAVIGRKLGYSDYLWEIEKQ